MAAKKAADATLYHLSPTGFWKRFRDAIVVNPQISSGLPIPSLNRFPQPASRPEKYSTPATKASDPAQNPYWKRDVRRVYPRLSVITQSNLSTFLIQGLSAQAVAAPTEDNSKTSTPTTTDQPIELSTAIERVVSAGKVFSEDNLPPALPTPFKKWVPQRAPDAPHAPHSYFPMLLYK